MKAVFYEKNGSPNLMLRETDKPVPKDDDLLVKIHAVSINAADYRSMRMGAIPKSGIFGADIAGRVEATGRNVTQFKPGDEVVADISGHGFGGFAEYVAVCETAFALKPASVSFEDAAATPGAALAALQALRDKGNIQTGQKVLICGAGGGVGTFTVQLAKHYGADVTAVCGPKNAALVKSLGADRVIDYTTEDFTQSASRYDLIVAINGIQKLRTYRRMLNATGILVVVGGGLSQIFKSVFFGPVLSLGGKKTRVLAAKPNRKDLEYLISLVESGSIKPVIDRRCSLDQTAEAVAYLEKGHAAGKVVIRVADDQSA